MAINIKPSHKGLLHKKLGIAADKKIPAAKIEKAKKSSSSVLKKEAVFAQNAMHWNKNKKPREVATDRGTFGFKGK